MLLKAPAKINLTLRILGKRPDGYHEIESIMQAIRLFDEVELFLGQDSGFRIQDTGRDKFKGEEPGIRLRCDAPGVPDGPANLAYRAAEAALAAWGGGSAAALPAKVEINLKKRIPAAAGLGGGSADAAAALLGLAKELRPAVALSEIAALGAAIGADVPFCVYACAAANPGLGYAGGSAALVTGVGEKVSPLSTPSARIILVKPPIEVSTAAIYALYDKQGREAASASPNDLEAPCAAAYPIVAETLARLKQLCGEFAKVQLSGSGPTVFAYIEGEFPAEQLFERAREAFPGMFTELTETL